jgi:hypothetical protein
MEIKLKPIGKDKCVMCDCDTSYKKIDHIDIRKYYVEGAGQLCEKCYVLIYGK